MTNKLPPLPTADTHCFDDDILKDCWSYSASQMKEYGLLCRDAALDEAAKVCDERANGENDAQWCADAIRGKK
jgi:hypothetical protein